MSSMYVKQRQTKGMTTSQLQGLSGEISYNYTVRLYCSVKPCDNNRCHRFHFQRKTQRDKVLKESCKIANNIRST